MALLIDLAIIAFQIFVLFNLVMLTVLVLIW